MISPTNVTSYHPRVTDCFFFDANIWLLLFCPIGNYSQSKQRGYSDFLRQANNAGSTLIINSLVLSEFCNRYLRIDFELSKREFPTIEYKKDYVGSETYQSTVAEIVSAVSNILQMATRISDDINAVSLERVYECFNHIDFNDSYYIELCERRNWILVSDDGDYGKIDSSIKLITANSRYFI